MIQHLSPTVHEPVHSYGVNWLTLLPNQSLGDTWCCHFLI